MTIQNKAAGYEINDTPNTINLLVEQMPTEGAETFKSAPMEDNVSMKWFEERHGADTDTIDKLRQEHEALLMKYRKLSDLDDDKCAHASALERKYNKLDADTDVTIRNLKNEKRKLNEALENRTKDEQLVFMLAGKLTSVGGRLNESVEEGGRTPWI